MCTLQAVFLLVVLGELLALALSLAAAGVDGFRWVDFGLRSFLIQWVVLLSAGFLCQLRRRLSRLPVALAGALAFGLVMLVACLCLLAGDWLLLGQPAFDSGLLSDLLLAAIFAGVVLHYLFVQQQLSNQQQAEARARLQALQARIHPHFLFNSMNSIASLIATQPDTAERVLEDLCSLFRASLAEPGMVSLADELQLCRQYVEIESLRLGARLRVDWQVAAAVETRAAEIPMPRLLLQPLLENAIQHGIQPRPDGGRIEVGLQLEDVGSRPQLRVQVRNPLPDRAPPAQGNGLALANIAHRLRAGFGRAAEFQARQEDGHFYVTIRYPCSNQYRSK